MLLASVSGGSTARAPAPAFVDAFVRRVETGVLRRAPRWRNRYQVTQKRRDRLAFRAADWWTAINVGLNDVEIAVSPDGHVRYDIRYARWAIYVLALAGTLGVLFIALLLTLDVRGYISQHSASRISRLSTDQSLAIAWAMALFWGFAWPWILIALHKRPLQRLMEGLIAEVDAAADR